MNTHGSAAPARLLLTISALLMFANAGAATLALPDTPLFLNTSTPPLNQLVLGRDHKLYYEAYNDAGDLNGDGVLDIRYKPTEIDYYGYFDSFKCYTYVSGIFEPQSVTVNKQCSNQWSGDFLNYLTTARVDALRKVLYGGFRSTDTTAAGGTILERTYIPQDAHSWGKEYNGLTDGYDIRLYAPAAVGLPSVGTRHLFANTTPRTGSGYTEAPRLRFLLNRTNRIWNWVSKEAPVADTSIDGGGGVALTAGVNDLNVRVRVCVATLLEPNCKQYPNGRYKPIGLLQEFGESNSMSFGLLTGSYAKNTSGGVLRRPIGSIQDEVNSTTGQFQNYNGVITSLNRLRVTNFSTGRQYPGSYAGGPACGWSSANAVITEGQCQMWGNPIGEMMYESLRYFAGKGTPTAAFNITFGQGEEADLPGGGMPVASWDNPYAGSSRPWCAKPFQTVVSDINPSYDSDQLPGTAFGSFTGDLAGLNVQTRGQSLWDREFGTGSSGTYFIGESGAAVDGAPTPKTVTSFGNIRGLAPEEPTKRGSYYAGSVADYGRTTDLNAAAGDQNVSTFAVALSSPLPKIEIPVNGSKITLVPYAKSVAGGSPAISPAGTFQPTNQIVDFYVDTLTPTYGRFRVNFEDVEQGADHDMDAVAIYEYAVVGGVVNVTVTSEYAQGGITQHMGYVISGTNRDGTYLVVRDQLGGDGTPGDVQYRLDTPPAFVGTPPAPSSGVGTWNDGIPLPFVSTRVFTPGATGGASLLKDPLWYAAKYGGFKDLNESGTLDQTQEWDADNDGDPDNYFLVTNALTLSTQLREAFTEIIARVASASSASVNSGSISSETRVYQAVFNSGNWTGQLLSFPVDIDDGTLGAEEWDAGNELPTPGSRSIITVNSNGDPVPFRWTADATTGIDATRKLQLRLASETTDAQAQRRLPYLRGDAADEAPAGLRFRARPTKLGDIVSSAPIFVGRPPFVYRDNLEAEPYSEFRLDNADRDQIVYAGANDGMLHAFDAETGVERLAFIPGSVFSNLRELSNPNYAHKFFVDGSPNMGDVFFNGAWHTVLLGGLAKGGQGIYALDITNPDSFSESNADDLVLWEFSDATDSDLGYTYSQPAIIRLSNGRWAAVFGNGYNSTTADGSTSSTGRAVLFVVDMETGNLIRKIDTFAGSAATPNGLGTPSVVDINGDSIADFVFAGDLLGNLWKFDLRNVNPALWNIPYTAAGNPAPLFVAVDSLGNRQPITGRPEVGRGPQGVGMVVVFGTGKYLEDIDKLLPPLVARRDQTFYGIIDGNTNTNTDIVSGRSALVQQRITFEGTVDFDGTDVGVRVTTENALGGNRGWYMDLISPPVSPGTYRGERVVSNPIIRNRKVIFTTLIPDTDPCGDGGGSWIMEVDSLSGSRLAQAPFDNNRDGMFDENDMVDTDGDGVPDSHTSGVQSEVGIVPEPGILSGDNEEYKYTPGTSGEIQVTVENPGAGSAGRQSWRQVR